MSYEMIPIDTGGIRESFVAETRQKFFDAGYDISKDEVNILVTQLPCSLYETLFGRVLQPMHGVEASPAPRTNEIYIEQAKQITTLEAENERLKCCGNCCWYSSSLGDCNDDVDDELDECNPSDGCHFTPPRWSFDHVGRHARAEMMPARGPDFGDGVWERRQDNPPGMGLINDVVPPDRVED